MSFELLTEIDRGAALKGRAKCRAALSAQGRVKNSLAKLIITVSNDVLAEIGAGSESQFNVLLGRDESAGLVRLQKSTGSGLLKGRAAPHKTSTIFNLGLLPRLPRSSVESQVCNIERVEHDTLEIVLPDFAKLAKEIKALPAPSAPMQITAKEVLHGAAQHNVTPGLMGDPPPQRSALSEHVATENHAIRSYLGLDGKPGLPPVIGGIKFATSERTLLQLFLSRVEITRRAIMAATHDPEKGDDERDEKIAEVFLSKLNTKLKTLDLKIRSAGHGTAAWVMPLNDKNRLKAMIKDAGEQP